LSLLGNSIKLNSSSVLFSSQPAQRLDGALIAMRPVEAGAGEQLDVATVDPRVHLVAVVLDLLHPSPAAASSTRRVSCGLIHLGGRVVVTTAATEANPATPFTFSRG
jgi:hypothetical protein